MQAFKVALRLCGLDEAGAAAFFDVAPQTIGKWSSGEVPVPVPAWAMLAQLFQRISTAASTAAPFYFDRGSKPPHLRGRIRRDAMRDPLPRGSVDVAEALIVLRQLADHAKAKKADVSLA